MRTIIISALQAAPLRHAPPHLAVLIPTLVVAALIAIVNLFKHTPPLKRFGAAGGNLASALIPRFFAFVTFLAGVILLFSGATPPRSGRLGWVNDILPLPIVELSSYFASIAGIGLIILARGLQRRLDAAYYLTVWVLIAGIVFAVLSALDIEQAVILWLMLIALWPNRKYFYRRASLFEERFTRGWIVAIVAVLAGTIALAWWGFGRSALSTQVFWRFSAGAQAPRAVRAITLAIVAVIVFAVARLLRPARPTVRHASAEELRNVEPIVAQSARASAHLVFLGDKAVMLNDARTAFIMYGVAGQSWVSLGDPIGEPRESADLVRRFVETADRNGGWPVFYRVAPQLLYVYLEYGLSAVKLGEVARVSLCGFSLDGPQRRNLRRVHRKMVDQGCTFEVLQGDAIAPVLPELRCISDDWLSARRAREKGFSLGRFDEAFISRFPVAIVKQNGKAVAFATAFVSGQHAEVEIDLMRFSSAAPPGVMRYLGVEFMFWSKAAGYQAFNLGMAPLSGLTASAVAPLWNQLVTAARGVGERYYNFLGLREFKEWFYPDWEPSYLVSPGGTRRPLVLASIAGLISGSVVGAIRR